MAKNVIVVGTQWGDEGKGKIVDWLTDHARGVVRFQGGHNAGHTLVVGDNVYKLNLVPSGVVRDGVDCYIGNGVVLDIHHLISEIAELEKGGIDVRSRLKISPGCPIILPYHAAIDKAREAAKAICKQRYLEFGCEGQAAKIQGHSLQVVAAKYAAGELAQVVN